jgi:hypothetical protein
MKIDNENRDIKNFSLIFGFGLIILSTIFTIKKHLGIFGAIEKYFSKTSTTVNIIYIVSFAVICIGFVIPQLLKPLYKVWMGFGNILGNINTKIIMSIIYFCIITPMAFFLRILGKDYLERKIDKKCESYWIKRKNEFIKESMEKQY